MGWVMIGLIVILIVFNMVMIGTKVMHLVKMKYKNRFAQRQLRYASNYSFKEEREIEC